MLLMLSLSLATVALADGAEVGAPTAAASAQPPQADVSVDEADEVVCKRVKVTGSHMRQRVCFKRSEWRAMRESARELMSRKLPNAGSAEG
ncbi:MAG: hypothetical protein OXE83_07175 [Gammaproteobacteria bacterium]|nr:hypothetical protein [Gammaproteobacteria bacterium]